MPAIAIFHRATITPTKADLIAAWAPTRVWGWAATDPIQEIGSYRFDDPDGRVGMETHLVNAGGDLFQVPLTYRDEPLDDAEDALITEMQHENGRTLVACCRRIRRSEYVCTGRAAKGARRGRAWRRARVALR